MDEMAKCRTVIQESDVKQKVKVGFLFLDFFSFFCIIFCFQLLCGEVYQQNHLLRFHVWVQIISINLEFHTGHKQWFSGRKLQNMKKKSQVQISQDFTNLQLTSKNGCGWLAL